MSKVCSGSNSTELAEATRPFMSAVPPIAAVNDRVPVPVTHLASEAATLGSPLPCARLDVGAISVCIAARPPNLGREKYLLHFLCIGLFGLNFEISDKDPRCGSRSPRVGMI
jgi:hypothetical protein